MEKKKTRPGTRVIIGAYTIFLLQFLVRIIMHATSEITLYNAVVWFLASSIFAAIGLWMNRSDKKTGHKPQPMPASMRPTNDSSTENKEG